MILRSVTPVPYELWKRGKLHSEHLWTIREIDGRMLWICDRDGCEVTAEIRAVHRIGILRR